MSSRALSDDLVSHSGGLGPIEGMDEIAQNNT